MELWQVIVALIQGLVEWLPISSEGQAVLFVYSMGAVPSESLLTLVIWLHIGTTLAVIVRYPRDIVGLLTMKDKLLFRRLLIATVGTAVTAVPLYFMLKGSFSTINGEMLNIVIGVLLVVTAIILYMPTRRDIASEEVGGEIDDKEALISGLLQGLAVLPGLSRSGVTISSLLMQRVDKEAAMKFSFLMSVPAVVGIFVLDVVIGGSPLPVSAIDLLLIEMIVFVTGLLSMEFLLRLAGRVRFWMLCLVLGMVAILFGIPTLFS